MELKTETIDVSLENFIKRNPKYKTAELDDELACIDEETGNYIGLNVTGKIIWEMLETPLSILKIIESFCEQFPEEQENITNDITNFILQLLSIEILLLADI